MGKKYCFGADPIFREVHLDEFLEFIKNYPRKLDVNVCAISDPPSIAYRDAELGSTVARTYAYDDNEGDYYYKPLEERTYMVMSNHEDVYNSRTVQPDPKRDECSGTQKMVLKEILSLQCYTPDGRLVFEMNNIKPTRFDPKTGRIID